MTAASGLCAAVAVWLMLGGLRSGVQRREPSQGVRHRDSRATIRMAVAVGTGSAVMVVLPAPAPVSLVASASAAWLCWHLTRHWHPSAARQARLLTAQAPQVADMLAACAAAGVPLPRALSVVADAADAPIRNLLASAAARTALGADPEEAWLPMAEESATAPIARAILRATSTGSAVAASLADAADELRAAARSSVEQQAQAVAVKTVGPLGVCFLPAFVLIGVVPLVAALLDTTVNGL